MQDEQVHFTDEVEVSAPGQEIGLNNANFH
jgi:hypothetical protein